VSTDATSLKGKFGAQAKGPTNNTPLGHSRKDTTGPICTFQDEEATTGDEHGGLGAELLNRPGATVLAAARLSPAEPSKRLRKEERRRGRNLWGSAGIDRYFQRHCMGRKNYDSYGSRFGFPGQWYRWSVKTAESPL